jgi:hypothetical protein
MTTRQARKGGKKMNDHLKHELEGGNVSHEESAEESRPHTAAHAAEGRAAYHHRHIQGVGAELDAIEQADHAQLAAQKAVMHEDEAAECLVNEAMASEDRAMREVERAMRDVQ